MKFVAFLLALLSVVNVVSAEECEGTTTTKTTRGSQFVVVNEATKKSWILSILGVDFGILQYLTHLSFKLFVWTRFAMSVSLRQGHGRHSWNDDQGG
jgi:hypothetical protein